MPTTRAYHGTTPAGPRVCALIHAAESGLHKSGLRIGDTILDTLPALMMPNRLSAQRGHHCTVSLRGTSSATARISPGIIILPANLFRRLALPQLLDGFGPALARGFLPLHCGVECGLCLPALHLRSAPGSARQVCRTNAKRPEDPRPHVRQKAGDQIPDQSSPPARVAMTAMPMNPPRRKPAANMASAVICCPTCARQPTRPARCPPSSCQSARTP